MVLLRGPFPPKIQTMPTVLSTDARQNLGPLGGRKGWGGGGRVGGGGRKGWGGAEGLGGGRKGWGGRGGRVGGAGRKGWGAGGGEEHEYPVFHLFLV